jgi:hypothetical protein
MKAAEPPAAPRLGPGGKAGIVDPANEIKRRVDDVKPKVEVGEIFPTDIISPFCL